jgi:uncharacterized protein
MKKSNYNFFFPLQNNKILAFNALKNGLAVIDTDTKEKIETLENNCIPGFDPETLGELEKGGFICKDELDELGLLSIRRHSQQFSGRFLGLTIAPTLNCNLDCRYCFETPYPGMMDERAINGVIEFVKKYIDSGIKRFDVAWYGGEPLLGIDIIEKLSRAFITLTEEHKVSYSAYIITNGTLLTRTTAEKLKELKVRGVQVTIDGPEETHNKRRPFRTGEGSFNRIFSNVKEATGIIPISLRTNVDTLNVDETLDFYKKLEQEEWFKQSLGKMINVHYGYVRKYSSSCKCSKEESLEESDFYSRQLELTRHLSLCTGKFDYFPSLSSGCGASSINSYVVGPRGELYKCWNHVGTEDKIVGNVFEPVEYNPLYISYLSESFEKDPECIRCKYLPICMGGCVDIRVKFKRGELDSRDCSQWKYYLEETLRSYYTSRRTNTASNAETKN